MENDDYVLTDEQCYEICEKYPYIRESNCLNWNDVKPALELIGLSLAGHEFREVAGVPKSWVTLEEFAEFYAKGMDLKDTSRTIKKALLLKPVKHVKQIKSTQDSDVKHTVSKAEERGFTKWINRRLAEDPDLTELLPIDVNVDGQLYQRLKNGVLLCKLINVATPHTIDERSINKGASLKNVFNVHENLTLAINSAAAIGCCVVNVGPDDIESQNRHIVLGLIWQLIRKGLIDTITLQQHSALILLLEDGETAEDLMRMKPEELLMRWVNYQMRLAGCPRRMTNFNTDIADSEIYTYLLDQIAPIEKRCKMKNVQDILSSRDDEQRAHDVLNNADVLGAKWFLSPEDIYLADEADQGSRDRLHIAFLATLFNMYPNLDGDAFTTIEGETLEERTYRNWMNSLGVRPYVTYLDMDLCNGLVLLQLIDIIEPHTVDWTMVVQKFDTMRQLFQEQSNCNMVVSSARKININFVNVSGEDIRERHKKLILGVVFQLMHAYLYRLFNEAAGARTLMPRDDRNVLEWANQQLEEAKAKQISGFRDPAFASGVPILQILEQIRPNSTNRDVWVNSTSDDLSLCRYAISCCRKAGAKVWALPEHLQERNGKMIQTILIALQCLDFVTQQRAEEAKKKKRKARVTWLQTSDKSSSDSE